MEKVKLGKSGIEVTPITFGAWAIGGWMWGGTDNEDAISAIHASLDHGISSIDTAPIYGMGHSEKIVGEAIKGRSRDKVEILTKYGMMWDGEAGDYYFDSYNNEGKKVKIYKYASKERVIKECENSLRRLQTDYIDLYQVHWPDVTTPVEETMEAVERLLEQGKVRAAGVCNYNVELTSKANDCIPIASDQVAYSMVNRGIESDLVPWCIENKVAIIAYSPLQRGLLTGKITEDYKFAEGDHRPSTPFFKKENIKKVNAFLDEIKPLAEDKNASLAQLVTAWTIKQPGIDVALVGGRNKKQASENALSADVHLTQDEVDSINQKLGSLSLSL